MTDYLMPIQCGTNCNHCTMRWYRDIPRGLLVPANVNIGKCNMGSLNKSFWQVEELFSEYDIVKSLHKVLKQRKGSSQNVRLSISKHQNGRTIAKEKQKMNYLNLIGDGRKLILQVWNQK